ncbi:MAG TPA: cation diffusion facilitator family transporter [Solirubrobacterales bacterium]|nr:cation diffusion facilitator family transporter [Solirubrobacterales bacterium]
MSHSHEGHSHGVSADADRGKLLIALALILGFMAAEVVAGILANSLALLSDAAHMLTDAAAIALSLIALRLSKRPARGHMTFGLKRAEILSAQINGVTLLVLATIILIEGVRRLFDPPGVDGALVLFVALAGIVVNLAATAVLASANRQSLNVEGSFQHILTDLYAFIGTAVAAAVILTTGFDQADALASLMVAALMLRSAYGLLRDSGRIFLEASPKGIDPDLIGRTMAEQPGVVEVHDLHVWEVTSGFPALSAHVTVSKDADCHRARLELAELIEREFDIHHTTLQVEHEPERIVQIES